MYCIQEYPLEKIRVEVIAARLFMQERFSDWRNPRDKLEGVAISKDNCLIASCFLEKALNSIDHSNRWKTVKTHLSSQLPHVFLADIGEKWIADITADQFGMPEAILEPYTLERFEIWSDLADDLIMDFELDAIEELSLEWRLVAQDYRESALEYFQNLNSKTLSHAG